MRTAVITVYCLLFSTLSYAQTLTANFTSDITGGCSPIVVNFQDQSTGNPVAWSWDFGNGAISNKQNPATTYFNTGTYTVTLTVTNAAGTTHTVTKTAYITVYNQPIPEFAANKTEGCTPAVIQFNDQSSAPSGKNIVKWQWDFGDGNSSTLQNPQHTYKRAGSFTVTLTITDELGCTKLITKPNYMNIIQGVTPRFDFVDPGVCSAPATLNFRNRSSGPGDLTYSWTLGNGNTATSRDASTTYSVNGTYRVSLIVSSDLGCADSTFQEIQVGKANTDFILPASICPKTEVQFLNNSTPRPVSAVWKFSHGATDTLRNGMTVFPSSGTYTVTLINTYTVCTDTLEKTITVGDAPLLDFNVSDTGSCQAPLTVNFSNASNGTSYSWDFGDGTTGTGPTPSHTYNNAGDFDVTLIATSAGGCSDTLKKPQLISIHKPEISFPGFPQEGCIPYSTNFASNVKTLDNVTSYSWDFGDGSTSTETTPQHTYSQQGTYTVSVTITTSSGCTETYSLPEAIKVGTEPVADFTSDQTTACAQPGIQFQNLSTGATDYLWTFSDGTQSTAANPLHTFSDIGPIDVTLTAINNGCRNKITREDYATILPSVSKFDYRPDCDNRLEITFQDQSIQAQTWSWNFGDGTTSTAQNPGAHRYSAPGNYNVSLTTTNGACTYTISRTVKVINANTPDFTVTQSSACKPSNNSFTATNPDAGLIKTWRWNFGDGSTDNRSRNTTTHLYTLSGVYDVTLTTVDSFGCTDTRTKPVRINGPRAGFTSLTNTGCKGMTTTFTDTTKTDGVNSIVNWTWHFGDGTTGTGANPSHTYDSIGDYDIKLVVQDAAGCADSVLYREFVKVSTLKAGWQIAPASCPGMPTGFKNLTTSDFTYTSTWYFGNGDSSKLKEPSYTYRDTGFFTVKLVVTDMYGCQDSLVQETPTKVAVPTASFTANNFTTYCTPFQAKFSNTSYFFQSSQWDLGGGLGTSTQTNPAVYYTQRGTFPVRLIVTSPGGCKDTAEAVMNIFNPNDGTITYDPLSGCRPLEVNLEAFSEMNARFVWDFADGNVIDTNVHKLTHVYDNVGDFVPRIILRQPDGCQVPLIGNKVIDVAGANVKFDLAQKLFCDTGTITILDSTVLGDPVKQYTWDFGDGTTSHELLPTHQYTRPGLYTVSLVVETQRGCLDSMTLEPPVKVVASPVISIGGPTVICASETIEHLGVFQQEDTSAVNWAWQLGNGTLSTQQNPGPMQYLPGQYTVTAVATNSSGCTDEASKNLTVHANPVITVPETLTKIVGVPLTIPATYTSGVVNYLWEPATGLDCTNCPQPVTSTKFTTDYTIAVLDSNNCAATEGVKVIVVCEGATIFLPNTFSPNGDGSNDVFFARGVGLDRVKSLRVFNRWGEIVFEQRDFPVNNQAYGWNGKYKGNKPHPDVYVYQVEIFCENGEIMRFEGNVALIL